MYKINYATEIIFCCIIFTFLDGGSPRSDFSGFNVFWGLSAWFARGHFMAVSSHGFFSVCAHPWCPCLFSGHQSHWIRAPLYVHLTLITTLKTYLQTQSHCGVTTSTYKSGTGCNSVHNCQHLSFWGKRCSVFPHFGLGGVCLWQCCPTSQP